MKEKQLKALRDLRDICEAGYLVLDAFLESPEEPEKPIEPPPATEGPMNRNEAILKALDKEMGTLEWKQGSNPRVELYLDHGFHESNGPTSLTDDVPWCAGFIAFILEANGYIEMGSTNSLMARSYEDWGQSSKGDELPGDIVTMWRGSLDAGTGHVTFFLGWANEAKTSFYGGGGNQNDAVNVSRYSTNRVTDFRRSSKIGDLTQNDRAELWSIADDILKRNGFTEGGKVT